MDYANESLKQHARWRGKITVESNAPVTTKEELSLAYTPGVAAPCLAIQQDVNKSYELTRRWNLCWWSPTAAPCWARNIGPAAHAGHGNACCLKRLRCDARCIKPTMGTIVETIRLISGSFGGINLEDIRRPDV